MSQFNAQHKELRLANGMQIYLQKTNTRTISGEIIVYHAGLHEKEHECGLAHLLEHVAVCGGTQKYSPEQIRQTIAGFGSIDASTSPNLTDYSIKIIDEDLEKGLDYLFQVVFNPRFEKEKVEQEKRIVLREIADKKSKPAFNDSLLYQKAVFGDGPHTYFVAGKEDIVQNAQQQDLRNFHSRGYNASNSDIILVGGLPDNIESLINKYFGKLPSGTRTVFDFPVIEGLKEKIIIHSAAPELINKENPQNSTSNMAMSVIVPSYKSPESTAIELLSYILGNGFNSRLFRAVRERKGLAYNVSASYNGSNNVGVIGIGAGIPALKQEQAINTVFDEMHKLQVKPVPAIELDSHKKRIMYNAFREQETNSGLKRLIERKINIGFNLNLYLSEVKEVTPQNIMEAANKYLPTNREDGKYVLLLRDPLKKQEH